MRNALTTLMATLALGLTAACTPAANPGGLTGTTSGGPSGGPSTDWKEGYGGDTLEIEVLREIEEICSQARELRPAVLNNALEAKDSNGQAVDVTNGLCGMMRQGELRIEIVDQPMVAGEHKDMANFPYEKPRRLQVKRAWWQDKKIPLEKRKALFLHELIPLMGLSDVDYVRSTRLLIALAARENRVAIVACDEKRIEAAFAGASSELLRSYSTYLGNQLCPPARDIMRRYLVSSNFGEELTVAIQHHFVWGSFQRMARAASFDEMALATRFLSESLDLLHDSLIPWSIETCNELGEIRPSQFRCGTMLDVIVGASPALKMRAAGSTTLSGLDFFDRAAVMLVKLMEARRAATQSVDGNPLFNSSGDVSRAILARTIEAQNWPLLMVLGKVHKKFELSQIPPHRLLLDLNFTEIRRNTVSDAAGSDLFDSRIRPVKGCTDEEVRNHATGVINGDRADLLVCGESIAI